MIMQPLIDAINNFLSLVAQLAEGETSLSLISFWIGLISLGVGIVAAIYAYLSAQRGENLLRRLVIYPFREMDFALSRLTDLQRDELILLFRFSRSGKQSFTADDARKILGQFGTASVGVLVNEGWIKRVDGTESTYCINPDRRAYLVFFSEASQEKKE